MDSLIFLCDKYLLFVLARSSHSCLSFFIFLFNHPGKGKQDMLGDHPSSSEVKQQLKLEPTVKNKLVNCQTLQTEIWSTVATLRNVPLIDLMRLADWDFTYNVANFAVNYNLQCKSRKEAKLSCPQSYQQFPVFSYMCIIII